MGKFVIETVTLMKQTYYVEVEDPTWAHDGIIMNELEPFAQEFFSEDIFSTRPVDEFPTMPREQVNGAAMKFNYETGSWDTDVRWDLAE